MHILPLVCGLAAPFRCILVLTLSELTAGMAVAVVGAAGMAAAAAAAAVAAAETLAGGAAVVVEAHLAGDRHQSHRPTSAQRAARTVSWSRAFLCQLPGRT